MKVQIKGTKKDAGKAFEVLLRVGDRFHGRRDNIFIISQRAAQALKDSDCEFEILAKHNSYADNVALTTGFYNEPDKRLCLGPDCKKRMSFRGFCSEKCHNKHYGSLHESQ